ncbi:MAG: serine/threonine-protein kinase, partial [Planctomycetota bacterium]
MEHSFKPLIAWCQKKSVDLVGFQEFVSYGDRFKKIHTYLKQNIDLEAYSHYLETQENTDLPSDLLLKWASLGQVVFKLLSDKKILLEELNLLLEKMPQEELTPLKLTPIKFLHHLLLQKKIRVSELLDFVQPNWTLVQEEENKYTFQLVEGKPQFLWKEKPLEKKLGNYQILEELGRGGMGAVYKVYHPHLQQTFALKVLIAGESASEKTLKRFHREVQTLAKLKHPGVIQIYDSGQEKNQHYFAMEFVDGKTLKEFLEGEPSLREKIEMFQKILNALFYAHEQGIIHRDLKPENVFVSREGTPKIGDFGLAKDTQEDEKLTLSGAILGTLRYMSPEQARGDTRHIDKRSDLYAMGVCLYEALLGQIPYISRNAQQLLEKICGQDPIPPSHLNKHIHRDLEAILLKSLEKEPFRRYQTAAEFSRDLEHFLQGYPILARQASVSEKCWKWTRQNRYKVVLSNLIFWSFLFFFVWLQRSKTQQFQNQSQALYERSMKEVALADTLSGKDPSVFNQKISHWLNALGFINETLQIQGVFLKAAKQKWEIGEKLLNLSLELESYQLANYVLKEMSTISEFSSESKQKLTQRLNDKQTDTLQRHQHELERFLQRLEQNKLSLNEQEEGIFLLSRFSEEAIFEKLLNLAKESESYFLHKATHSSEKNRFYEVIVTILGRLGNPKSAPFLREALEKMQQKSETTDPSSEEIELLSYMIILAQALGNIGGEADA